MVERQTRTPIQARLEASIKSGEIPDLVLFDAARVLKSKTQRTPDGLLRVGALMCWFNPSTDPYIPYEMVLGYEDNGAVYNFIRWPDQSMEIVSVDLGGDFPLKAQDRVDLADKMLKILER